MDKLGVILYFIVLIGSISIDATGISIALVCYGLLWIGMIVWNYNQINKNK